MTTSPAQLEIFDTREAWLEGLLEHWHLCAEQALNRTDRAVRRFAVALPGGSTPAPFFEALASSGFAAWSETHLVVGDERTVPEGSPQHNGTMIRRTLADRVGVVGDRFYGWRTELEPDAAATEFEARLRSGLGEPPRLDLAILGIGADGHTASLFPGTRALDECERWAVANEVPQLETTRLTLTFPVFATAQEIWFLVAGADKRPIVDAVLAQGSAHPASRIEAAGTVRLCYCRV